MFIRLGDFIRSRSFNRLTSLSNGFGRIFDGSQRQRQKPDDELRVEITVIRFEFLCNQYLLSLVNIMNYHSTAEFYLSNRLRIVTLALDSLVKILGVDVEEPQCA